MIGRVCPLDKPPRRIHYPLQGMRDAQLRPQIYFNRSLQCC
ncbi:hypothetical protein J2R80_005943 [Bradyrhizobium sp. USDA 4541]|nr:hypothetical protein [Bradyrhizobium sp. USDA 4541]